MRACGVGEGVRCACMDYIKRLATCAEGAPLVRRATVRAREEVLLGADHPTVADKNGHSWFATFASGFGVYALEHIEALSDFSEDHVLAVALRRRGEGDIES